jgi:tetratricopeptide (TPR) repeat protein
MGRPALAESLLTVAIAADSTRFVLWFKRGLSRFNEARFADARIDFERALAVENRPEAWFNLGLACDALGDRECAAASLDRYLELGPEGPARDRAAKLLERLARP